jgi:hypothetical protein
MIFGYMIYGFRGIILLGTHGGIISAVERSILDGNAAALPPNELPAGKTNAQEKIR